MAALPTLVWALDNEPGARAYTHKHIKRAAALGFESRAAQIVQRDGKKTDWNDLHLRAIASDDPKQWNNDINEARYQGDLLVARSAVDKGLLMFEHDGRNDFWLSIAPACTGSTSIRSASTSCARRSSATPIQTKATRLRPRI